MKTINLRLTAMIILCACLCMQAQGTSTYTPSNSYNSDTLIETSDILTISLSSANSNIASEINNGSLIIDDNNALTWENNGADIYSISSEITLDLSSGLDDNINTNVTYVMLARQWEIIESNDNMPTVNISIPIEVLTSIDNQGKYFMFVSDSEDFETITDYKAMTANNSGYLETDYDFNGTSYITFGSAPIVNAERSIYFNGVSNFIDLGKDLNLYASGFTISAWVNPLNTDNRKVSILSKRDAAFTEGYSISLYNNKIRVSWKNGDNQPLTSHTALPNNEWHHIAVTYNGAITSIFIDGVLDNTSQMAAPITTNQSLLIAAAAKESPTRYFKGHVDEIRIWNSCLSDVQLRYIMNQEIEEDNNTVSGKTLPHSITKNDIGLVPWSDLAAYYPMSHFAYKSIIDDSDNHNDGKLNSLSVDTETSPLPYISHQNGSWQDHTSWNNGIMQYIPGSTSIVDSNTTIDWNIVEIAHNLTMTNGDLPSDNKYNRTLLGLSLNDAELVLAGNNETLEGNGLTITHYLDLNGKIDLEGKSQLIQTQNSDLNVSINGEIECDQQGTADNYTYNYWSSPVTLQNSSGYKIADVMLDGTNPNDTHPINFLSSSYDGNSGSPIGIADYWIWKFANQATNNYSAWQHIRQTGQIFPGEGFTMKGPGTGSITESQNYVFRGTPNSGDINLNINANNDYLIGNPYPSAMDADAFIRDNGLNENNTTPLTTGTLYFWDHWGGNSHFLSDYKGGYAMYNLSGAVAAASKGSLSPNFGSDGLPARVPNGYIPVGQGFFVVGQSTGNINFNNGQRVFKGAVNSNENQPSENNALDDRMKIRLGFNSITQLHRQLLLTIDENASPNVDWAYDAIKIEDQRDDMFWLLDDDEYIIQASNEAEISSVYPIGIRTSTDGLNTITIDALENTPENLNIYIYDNELDIYHDLRESDYEIYLNEGEYLDRFMMTFDASSITLSTNEENSNRSLDILYANNENKIVLINPNAIDIKTIEVFNIIGQSIMKLENISELTYSEYDVRNLNTGTYIIKLVTTSGYIITEKVLVR